MYDKNTLNLINITCTVTAVIYILEIIGMANVPDMKYILCNLIN